MLQIKEEHRDVTNLKEASERRLRGDAKDKVLRLLEEGIIDLDDIENVDVLILARLHLRARRLRREIARLQEARSLRRQREFARLFG